jgi:predicted nucleic acid-binding protein
MSKKQGTKCEYLLETSSLYPLLISEKTFNLEQCAVGSLTEYELGNVLWKEAKTRKINIKAASQIYSDALLELKKISINSIADVLTLALERNLTFYDASYVYIAEKEGLILVTEDKEILDKCKRAKKTNDIEDLGV